MADSIETSPRPDVRIGWKVRILDNDYLNDSRDDVTVTHVSDVGVTLRPRRPWGSQGRKFPTMDVSWERLEWHGNTARLYRVATSITSRSYPGQKQLVKVFEFSPPRT